jgi:hypothetical protein
MQALRGGDDGGVREPDPAGDRAHRGRVFRRHQQSGCPGDRRSSGQGSGRRAGRPAGVGRDVCVDMDALRSQNEVASAVQPTPSGRSEVGPGGLGDEVGDDHPLDAGSRLGGGEAGDGGVVDDGHAFDLDGDLDAVDIDAEVGLGAGGLGRVDVVAERDERASERRVALGPERGLGRPAHGPTLPAWWKVETSYFPPSTIAPSARQASKEDDGPNRPAMTSFSKASSSVSICS